MDSSFFLDIWTYSFYQLCRRLFLDQNLGYMLVFFFLFEYSIISLMVKKLLYIVLFGTATDCSLEIISCNVGKSLFVSVFVIILWSTLKKSDMGLDFAVCVIWIFFGNHGNYCSFHWFWPFLFFKKIWFINSLKSFFIMGQNFR